MYLLYESNKNRWNVFILLRNKYESEQKNCVLRRAMAASQRIHIGGKSTAIVFIDCRRMPMIRTANK